MCLGLNSLSSYLPYQLFVKLLHSPSEVSPSAKADLSCFVDVFDLQMPVRLCVRICVSRWISAVCPLCTNGGVVFSYNEGQTL